MRAVPAALSKAGAGRYASGGMTPVQFLEYYGAIAGALAALIVSLDLGRRATGIGFVIFVTSSLALVAWGLLGAESAGIGWQNVVLFVINCIGVYRYLIRKKRPGVEGREAMA